MEIHYIGHSTVQLSDGTARVLVDPSLAPHNPAAKVSAEEVDPTHILLTHGHQDHYADAVAVGKRTGAPFLAISELANLLDEEGLEVAGDPNLGGTFEFDWGWVKLVQAVHSNTVPAAGAERPFSPTTGTVIGASCGLVIKIGGKTIYHLGDTALFGDLKLIANSTPVDVALIPIGGHYTMDRHDAVTAAELIGAETVVPIHYDTYPPIETDSGAFKSDVESKTSSKVVLMKPGDTETF
ncbi:MAG: metal-dependent hydrolase [Solirubrobacterales bacterium]|nr:metal-dependent hydrolase [Solirubrobacterales bacterium]